MPTAYAHSRDDTPESEWEPLERHLLEVAQRARQFADAFGSGDWGHWAGLWHDLGKYRPAFQRRIRGSGESAPHASVGAAHADRCRLMPLAFVIAGHHAGLANPASAHGDGPRPLRETVLEALTWLQEAEHAVPGHLLGEPLLSLPPHLAQLQDSEAFRGALNHWIRFLFSALVDADRLATEAFYNGDRSDRVGGFSSLSDLAGRVDAYLDAKVADSEINIRRAAILASCRRAATLSPGFFSLSVPTGGGKTLAGMSFALRHAVRHGLRRVVVVAPFTSIIDQNAAVYRQVMGASDVIEHHSAVQANGDEESTAPDEVRRRLITENWDAPVIVTTAVQFLESLFANSPSRCRKLHNITRSVIVLDEAQTLPIGLLRCVLDALRELVRGYGCSVVLSTATQPALIRREALPEGLVAVRDIVPDAAELASSMRRVHVEWPTSPQPTTWRELADDLARHPQVLAIVHRRKDAHDLAAALPADARIHLSTRMCPAHRLETLDRIRRALKERKPCRVVSTQLVEAGVDLDFPVVYRAMAGLDSIAQAAGRCNREGLLLDHEGVATLGRVVVFRAETKPPAGVLRKGWEVAESMLATDGTLDLLSPSVQERYFRLLYAASNLDAKHVVRERDALNFATVASLVRLIDDQGGEQLVVPWGSEVADLVRRFRTHPTRDGARRLQLLAVAVRPRELVTLQQLGAAETLEGFGAVLAAPYQHLYDETYGLVLDGDAAADPEALMI